MWGAKTLHTSIWCMCTYTRTCEYIYASKSNESSVFRKISIVHCVGFFIGDRYTRSSDLPLSIAIHKLTCLRTLWKAENEKIKHTINMFFSSRQISMFIKWQISAQRRRLTLYILLFIFMSVKWYAMDLLTHSAACRTSMMGRLSPYKIYVWIICSHIDTGFDVRNH